MVLTAFALAAAANFFLIRNRATASFALPISVLLMLGLSWLSLSWSVYASFGLRRVLALSFCSVTIGCLVGSLHRREVPRLVAWTLAGLLIANFISVLVLPGAIERPNGIDPTSVGGGWRGLNVDKNMAGAITAVTVLTALYMLTDPFTRWWGRCFWLGIVLLGMVYVWFTGSKTSLALVPVAVVLGLGIVLLSRVPSVAGIGALVLLPSAAFVWLVRSDWSEAAGAAFTAMLQDPRSFTGRSQIWNVVLEESQHVPWLGYGYGSFWLTGEGGPVSRRATGYLSWLNTVPNSHSGYFDMLIQLGRVGLAGAVLAAIVLPLAKLVAYRTLDLRTRWLIAMTTLFFAFHNFLETSLFDRVQPLWIIQLTMIATLAAYRVPIFVSILGKTGEGPAARRRRRALTSPAR